MHIIERLEKPEKKNQSISIPVPLRELLKEYAIAKNRKASEIVAIAVRNQITADTEFMRNSGHAPLITTEAVQKPPKKAKTAAQGG